MVTQGSCIEWKSTGHRLETRGKQNQDLGGDKSKWGRRQWHPTPVLLPGKSPGPRAWCPAVHGATRSQTRLSDFTFTFYFHALENEMATHSNVRSCLENPRDRGAWWADVYGVAQSRTQLKRLSSSSSSKVNGQ